MLNSVLNELIKSKTLKVGVIGLGYVGLPLSLAYVEAGINVLGFDVDPTKITSINNKKSYIKHISDERIAAASETGLFSVSNDFSLSNQLDALIICVPTPLTKYREPDLSYIRSTMSSLLEFLRPGQILSLESTTYPGTTEEEILPLLQEKGLTVGADFYLIYSPEREDPGNLNFETSTIPKVVGGATKACLDLGTALYSLIIEKVVPVSSTSTAEMTKLLENIHRAVNIGLVNELKPLCDKMGIDIYEVINAAATKPFGFVPYYPGPGLGGHCIPIDPFYLTWKAREFGMHTRFIELAGEVNTSMPEYVVSKVVSSLNDYKKPLKGSKILVLGLAYKKNIDDTRESPSVEIMQILACHGALVSYNDPYISTFPKMRKYNFDLSSEPLTSLLLKQVDAVIIATDHDAYDFSFIEEHSQLIIDTRGRLHSSNKVIRA